jgi:type IV pilus assembly protein PilA
MFSSIMERLNERRDGAREAGGDAGFTLIELMVVLLIMAILLAIAIPTFLGVSSSANDRAAQSNLNTALTNLKSYYQSNGQQFTNATYTNASSLASQISTQEPSISWTAGPSTGSGVISVGLASDGNGVVLAALAKTGVCWYLVDNEATEGTANYTALSATITGAATTSFTNSGTFYGGQNGMTSTTCTAASAGGATSWSAVGSGGFPGGLK